MKNKYFGTDGIRGRVGDHPITADFILKLGRAVGTVLAADDKRAVVIGKDTRISGYMFESALEAGLAAAGANVLLLGPMPTPAVAYLTRTLYACAGIVISASHNPYQDNGYHIGRHQQARGHDGCRQGRGWPDQRCLRPPAGRSAGSSSGSRCASLPHAYAGPPARHAGGTEI